MANLDDLNARAEEKFNRLKAKQGWSVDKIQELQKGRGIKVDKEKIESMIEANNEVIATTLDKGNEITERQVHLSPVQFIDSLELSSNLSIAIGFIVASKNKDKQSNLKQAILYLEQEILNG